MRIAVVTEHWEPGGGGAERSAAQIVQELRERGHGVTVLAGAVKGHVQVEGGGVEVRTYPGGSLRGVLKLVGFGRWVRGELRGGGWDASVSFTTWAAAGVVEPRSGLVVDARARSVARRETVGARLVKRVALWLTPRAWVSRWVERGTMRDPGVVRYVAISEYMRTCIQRRYGIDPARVVLIPNGAEVEEVTDERKAVWRDTLRKGLRIDADTKVLLFLANDPERKGVYPLLAAMERVVQRCRRGSGGLAPVLWIAGPLCYRVHERVVALGLRERVRFLGSTRRPDPLYAAVDVTVLPSFYDPASKVVIESLRMGTPAITTSTNGSADWIRGEPDAGRVIEDAADVEALTAAIEELLDTAKLAACRIAASGIGEAAGMARHVDALVKLLEMQTRERGASPTAN